MATLQDKIEAMDAKGDKSALLWNHKTLPGGQKTLIGCLTFRELHESIQNYSKAFLELGLEKGDKVALFAENVPEWIGLNLGIANAGLIDAPRGKEATAKELDYILDHSEAEVIIVEDQSVLDKLDLEKHDKPVYSITLLDGVKHISELEQLGRKSDKKIPRVSEGDVAGFIYTSGTTGIPKGAMLTHGNFTSNVESILKRVPMYSDDKILSMLPPWHSFERIIKYSACAAGVTTFVSSKETMLEDLATQKPTIMASVPKVWERAYDGFMAKIAKKGFFERTIAQYAVKKSVEFVKEPTLWRSLWNKVAQRVVFPKLHEALGGNLRLVVSGGGALPAHVDYFFHAAGLGVEFEILEGYGMTETAPLISVRTPGEGELQSVGTLIEGIEAKLLDPDTGEEVEEGVLHVKGPNVMIGYYKDDEETREVLNDGWMKTGDICYFDEKNRLHITGRAKEMIVLSNGENVPPVPIESALKQSPHIEDAVVVGQDWKGLAALVVPDPESTKGMSDQEIRDILNSEIKKYVSAEAGFQRFHFIRDFEILPESFVVGEEITATLKPMRRKIDKIYEADIAELYARVHK